MSEAAATPSAPTPVPPAPLPRPSPTVHEKAAWIFMALGFYFALQFKLLPALLAGLFVHSLVHALAKRITRPGLSHARAKLVAVAVIGFVIVALSAAAILVLIAFLKGKLGDLPTLLDKMAHIVESARERLGLTSTIPAAEDVKDTVAKGLHEHSQELQHVGGEIGRMSVHALVGIVIGALTAFETRKADAPLSTALSERLKRLGETFEKVVFAQIRISALNTTLTALYLLVALPLSGIELPLRKTLVLVTFIVGLIPVVGNLISNSAIVIIALGVSPSVAVSALIFLIVIHKLEYFLNAKIMGDQVHAAAWEMLLAMLCFEAVFGISGVIVAPIAYAYAKRELQDRGVI